MIIHQIEQGTDEWLQLRLGKATASRFKDIIATNRDGQPSTARAKYRAELLHERLFGRPVERYRSAAMEWGNDTETLARVTYSAVTGNVVAPGPFVQHDQLPAGASPDGLVGDEGTIEIKCYELHNHIAVLRTGQMPALHMAQVQGQLWLSERQWCDFISFAPELPDNAQIFVQRIERDEKYAHMLQAAVESFLIEVEEEMEFVKNWRPGQTAAAGRAQLEEMF